MPSYQFVDQLKHPKVRTLEEGVCNTLAGRGLTRLHADDLSAILPHDTDIPTNLSDPPWRHFDALFYWED